MNIVAARSSNDDSLVVNCGSGGNITQFKTAGFDLHDGEGATWTEKQTASIEVSPRWFGKDLLCEMNAIPHLVPNFVQKQDVFVYVNGLFCAFKSFFEQSAFQFTIPKIAVSGRSTQIIFVLPSAVSPKQLGIGEDVRELGIAMINLSLRPV